MTAYIKEFAIYTALLFFILIASFTDAKATEQAFYYGLSGGQTRVKNTTTQQYQAATSLGVKVGMRLFSNESFWTGAELKFTQTTAKQEVTQSGVPSSTYEAETTGLYLTGRTQGKAYVKGKIGAANQRIRVNDILVQDSTRGSAGVGVGLRQGAAVLEIEYTQYGEDVTIVSVGYVF